MMTMEREKVHGFEPDLRGNTNRKNRKRGGLVRDASRLLAYGQ